MWVVNGLTANGKTVEYKVPAGKDTDKAFVLALAFQEHGAVSADDPLTAETTVQWTSDNIAELDHKIRLFERSNFAVDRRIGKGLWERHTPRAFRSLEAASEVLESAASEYPSEKFRIVVTHTVSDVVAVSKNALLNAQETPDPVTDETKAEEGKAEAPADETEAKAPAEENKPKSTRTRSKAA